MSLPDEYGRFGAYGGQFVPETVMPALEELKREFKKAMADPVFKKELDYYLKDYAGRPTPLYHAAKISAKWGGATVYLKREDLNHTGAHKINNALGQALLVKRMGKKRVVAETGAGQHGVAVATAAALFGFDCTVYMGAEDIRRQKLNVFRMEILGAKVAEVTSGSQTLKDATNEAIRDWVTNVEDTHYIIGSVVGPHPYPLMVREFQSVIGRECRAQILEKEGRLPAAVIACVGGGSNAAGIFYPFLDDPVRLIGVEAAGKGIASGYHAASLSAGRPGVLHGAFSYLLQDEEGQIKLAHSISAGLDYPGVGPEHSYLKDNGRVEYDAVTDEEAIEAFFELTREEGIIPALECSHALAYAPKIAKELGKGKILIINLSGRGDKDVDIIAGLKGEGSLNDVGKIK